MASLLHGPRRGTCALLLCSLLALGPTGSVIGQTPDPCSLSPASLTNPDKIAAFLKAGCYKAWPHDPKPVRATGPKEGESAPHGKVRVYYSPEVVTWLRGGRKRELPQGAFLYKEMYNWQTERYTGGAYMVRTPDRSYDGWYWGGYNARTNTAWGALAAPGCLNCHASAERALTFACLSNLEGHQKAQGDGAEPGRAPARAESDHEEPSRRIRRRTRIEAASPDALPEEPDPPKLPSKLFRETYPTPWNAGSRRGLAFPDESLGDDHVAPAKEPDDLLTSGNCMGCHNADPPEMVASAEGGKAWNLSPYGEWSGSLMGLSGRDPVFHAQLAYEKSLRPGITGFLDNTCYSCHGVMGQRQLQVDRKQPFSHEMVYAGARSKDAKYGALARDGVSCMACHRMDAKGLGEERSFTGRFALSAKGIVHGPYGKDLRTLPMKNALGLTVQEGAHLRKSSLCGSCHEVHLPKLQRSARLGPNDQSKGPRSHEQTTYLEWRHSAYQDEVRPLPSARTCQSCHMSTETPAGKPIQSKIASIEEYLPHIEGSLPRKEITLTRRTPYARHSLVGLNYFVLQLFDQFDEVLGIARRNPEDDGRLLPALDLARRETLRLAQERTATVGFVEGPRVERGMLGFVLRIRNLAGHKLPSGVGFRRAFVEVKILGHRQEVLWASGRSDDMGVILGGDNRPLPSEFTNDPKSLERHHQVIGLQEEAQIYEERHTDDKGALTTSFVGLFQKVKDNRLLPLGFSWGNQREALAPVGTSGDPEYESAGKGEDQVRYQVKEAALAGKVHSVEATLYYQALPPYYLKNLFSTVPEPGGQPSREIRRLYYMASRLQVGAPSPIAGWKLRIASARANLP